VVPYTRGAEVHRPPGSIVDECKRLVDAGVIEITLLGQTVNHYIDTHGAAVGSDGAELPQVGPGAASFKDQKSKDAGQKTTTFAGLLHRIHEEVPGLARLRFVTSFPRDFGDDILHVMASCPRICRYIHVPAQSGSNRILKLMNRGYTVEEYLEFIDRAKAILPGVSIAGDFIVGFPTETDEDFATSKDLIRRVGFKNSFIFKYSPRPGTIAIDRFADDVPEHIKRARNNELLAVQAQDSDQVHRQYIGRVVDVFVERAEQKIVRHSPADGQRNGTSLTVNGRATTATLNDAPAVSSHITGRTDGDLIVSAEVEDSEIAQAMVGSIVQVEVTDARPLLLRGSVRD
jgi:tRNA-2-methylthio-N6-dimethylallyladenosine synthase